ncbi:hypothetical protein [Actinacidiphila sp. ITFR-21]|uniref:hypothetical protein n=1 Tax=Actinacidiphila sp. ITFR-21 TaxID=3075199 RepID=UPI00288A2524|nr:hypothetical protein [Streptomyces sp. ITFR-21]WNI18919.1 hypothetical protein RLT57_27585 [Streptomyces sp. ITFR-21]
MALEYTDLFARLAAGDANGVVKAFAANPAFRAAEWEELTTEDNPYRRPVRPDDLAWLDYGKPMPVAKALKLSALLGHRMLRNVYDSGLLHLPPAAGPAAAADGALFYDERNRVLGAMAAPVLERHLFTLLESERKPLAGYAPEQVAAAVGAYHEQRLAEPGRAFAAALSTKDRKASATFVLLQLSAYLPASRAAVGRAALGEYDIAHPGARIALLDDYRTWAGLHGQYRALLEGAGLKTTTGAYWQLYLGTSLARGNHLHRLSRDREKYPEFLGALLHHGIDQAVTAAGFADVFEDGFGTRPALFDHFGLEPGHLGDLTGRWVEPLLRLYGPSGVERFHHGFADAAWLAGLWDEDLARQLAWADSIPEHQDKAERISRYIQDNGITVDLDTFVESHEETSTTHVHDEHRLVMVERGQMHFWNNVTHKIALHEGDKVLIPVSRLHGSTVLSGECTYHQPIIPEDMYARF